MDQIQMQVKRKATICQEAPFYTLGPPVTDFAPGAYAHARANQHDKAMERRGELEALATKGYMPAFCFASAALGFNEHDRAVEYLEKAYEAKERTVCLLGVEPFFDDLRQHPAFMNLVRRLKFPSPAGEPQR